MAATMASAFTEVEGPKLDLLAGLSVPRVQPAQTEEAVALAFAGVGYGPFRRVARMLSSRYRRHLGETEEAVQDTLLDLYVKRRSLFREDPENWLALLYSLAKFRLTRVETGRGRIASIEA